MKIIAFFLMLLTSELLLIAQLLFTPISIKISKNLE